jgi:transcriptional regulator with XRE-family HTH domain
MGAIQKRKAAPLNPIRLLREVAGGLTQTQLSEATTIPLDSVRGLENNRRTLSERHLERIKFNLGAEWDPKREVWHLVDRPDEPYSSEWYQKFRTKWFKHAYQYEIEAHVLCRRLIELLLQVEDSDYNGLFYRLYDFLDQTREELHLTGARRVFDKTRFQVDFLRNGRTKEVEGIVRQFSGIDEEIVTSIKDGSFSIADWLNFKFLTRDRTKGS